jgi:hypothetical protein
VSSFLGFSFLVFSFRGVSYSWRSGPRRCAYWEYREGVASTGSLGSLGSPRQSRQSSAATRPPTASPCSRVMAGCFKGVSGRGSMREVEDILLSEGDDGGKGKGKGRASYI